jgi:hypothetical protein
MCRRSSLLTGEGGGGGRGAASYESEKAWPSINHSILSGSSYRGWQKRPNKNIEKYMYSVDEPAPPPFQGGGKEISRVQYIEEHPPIYCVLQPG